MRPNNTDIPFLRVWIIEGDVLLNSKSQLVFMTSYHGTRSLSDILTPSCVLDDAKVGHVPLTRQYDKSAD